MGNFCNECKKNVCDPSDEHRLESSSELIGYSQIQICLKFMNVVSTVSESDDDPINPVASAPPPIILSSHTPGFEEFWNSLGLPSMDSLDPPESTSNGNPDQVCINFKLLLGQL